MQSYFFPVHKLLETYGQPDKVLVTVGYYDKSSSIFEAFVDLVYDNKNILADYYYFGTETTNLVNLCLSKLHGEMFLLAPNTELNLNFSDQKPLDEFSELTPKTFYERFKDKNNKCFEMSKDAWK